MSAADEAGPSSFSVERNSLVPGMRGVAALACGRVKAGRRPPEGLGLDSAVRRPTLAKGLSANAFLAGKPDGRGRLAPFPLAGRAGGWVDRCLTRSPTPPPNEIVAFHTKRHRATRLGRQGTEAGASFMHPAATSSASSRPTALACRPEFAVSARRKAGKPARQQPTPRQRWARLRVGCSLNVVSRRLPCTTFWEGKNVLASIGVKRGPGEPKRSVQPRAPVR